jgi:hypothetical protein
MPATYEVIHRVRNHLEADVCLFLWCPVQEEALNMGLTYFHEPYDMSKKFTVSDLGEGLFIGEGRSR